MIWEPLFVNKFGEFAHNVSLAWFWARITKRTPSLAYPAGGFLHFAKHLEKKIRELGGSFHYQTEVVELSSKNNPQLKYKRIGNWKLEIGNYDAVVVTLPTFLFIKTAPQLTDSYKNKFIKLRGLGATNLVLQLSKPFFKDNTYWLSVCDKSSPIMAIVEHTNFMNKSHYNNDHLVYLGNYLSPGSEQFSLDKDELLKKFDPFLKKINPNYRKSLINYQLFKAPFAQPIIPMNYSKMIPQMTTPLKNVYLANIEQVYPWDRGTNYAIELGEKVAKLIEGNK